ncbi:IclR family transcriptional regulator [Novosphingobium sp.]|uniref:IclR family transcriptional regulator n=1 Tax=Novosphingobium sp. TaxID=1874826 RepID=UPI0035B1337E
MVQPGSTNTVKSALRTLDIIEFVVAHPQGPIAQDIAAALDIPVSSLSYLLSTLLERGYLVRDGRRYRPGPGLDRLTVKPHALTLGERVEPLVKLLRSDLDETASFMIRSGWEVEALVTESSGQALRYAVDRGERKPLHSLAAGKAILATMSEDELELYFSESARQRFTEHTIVAEAALREELKRIRREGVAEAHQENTRGICGMACPAWVDGQAVGAFAVAIPEVRFDAKLAAKTRAALARAAASLAAA